MLQSKTKTKLLGMSAEPHGEAGAEEGGHSLGVKLLGEKQIQNKKKISFSSQVRPQTGSRGNRHHQKHTCDLASTSLRAVSFLFLGSSCG